MFLLLSSAIFNNGYKAIIIIGIMIHSAIIFIHNKPNKYQKVISCSENSDKNRMKKMEFVITTEKEIETILINKCFLIVNLYTILVIIPIKILDTNDTTNHLPIESLIMIRLKPEDIYNPPKKAVIPKTRLPIIAPPIPK